MFKSFKTELAILRKWQQAWSLGWIQYWIHGGYSGEQRSIRLNIQRILNNQKCSHFRFLSPVPESAMNQDSGTVSCILVRRRFRDQGQEPGLFNQKKQSERKFPRSCRCVPDRVDGRGINFWQKKIDDHCLHRLL